MSSSKDDNAPIKDLSFHSLPKSSRTKQRRRGSNESSGHASFAADDAEDDQSSAASGIRRRFFPSNLFGNNKGHNKAPPVAMTPNLKTPDDSTVIRSIKVWDVRMPPMKKHMVKNHLFPTMRGAAGRYFIQKHRRITIEVHGPPNLSLDCNHSTISSMTPFKTGKMQEFLQGNSPQQDDQPLQDKDEVVVRILKLSHDKDDSHAPDDDDGHSVSTLGAYAPDDTDEFFVEHYAYRLEDVEVMRQHGRTCEMRFGSGQETIIRDIKFEAEKDAVLFEACLNDVRQRVQERARRLAQEYRDAKRAGQASTTPVKNNIVSRVGKSETTPQLQVAPMVQKDTLEVLEEGEAEIRLLIDIVSAIDLPATDMQSTDAYVIVQLGSKEVHRTKAVATSLNPIWTIESQSLFLLEVSSEDFFTGASGLTFVVKDHDTLVRDDVLGIVLVPQHELLEGTGERKVFPITPNKPSKSRVKPKNGKLVLRFKEASRDDVEFMRMLNKSSRDVGVFADETFLAPRPPDSTTLKRLTNQSSKGELHRIKPFPDPDDPVRTKWMSDKDIQAEALKESRGWVEAGSGTLGKLFVEIIGCDNLPNLDSPLNARDKTDAFACLVFEDSMVNTDVIGDTLKPRWMPWSCRAFVLNISHSQSKLFLGIFDYDSSTSHDPVGRVTINLGRYSPFTLYNLKLALYSADHNYSKEKDRATVSLRLRIEWEQTRKAILDATVPASPSYVSCDNRHYWRVAQFTIGGGTTSAFNIQTLTKYFEELQDYQKLTPFVIDAGLSLLLWRSTCRVNLCCKTVGLPIHSVIAFAWGLLVTWNFNMFPACFAFSIGWFFVAMNQHLRNNPSPWYKPFGYWGISSQLLYMHREGVTIKPQENIEEFEKHMSEVRAKEQQFEEERKLVQTFDEELREEFSGEVKSAQAEEVAIQTKREHFASNLRPLKHILYPVQIELEKVVRSLRIVVSVVRWDEPFFAWWITTICFAASFVLVWIPWGFIIRWTLRVAVFVLLGPWMAIYDRCFLRRTNLTPEQHAEEIKNRVKQRYLQMSKNATSNRTRRERAMKLKSMKKFLYGKFLTNVPCFGVDGHASVPLLESSAYPYDSKKNEGRINVVQKKYGQALKGDMIPTCEFQITAGKGGDKTTAKASSRLRKLTKLRRQLDSGEENKPLLGASNGHTYESVGGQTNASKSSK